MPDSCNSSTPHLHSTSTHRYFLFHLIILFSNNLITHQFVTCLLLSHLSHTSPYLLSIHHQHMHSIFTTRINDYHLYFILTLVQYLHIRQHSPLMIVSTYTDNYHLHSLSRLIPSFFGKGQDDT